MVEVGVLLNATVALLLLLETCMADVGDTVAVTVSNRVEASATGTLYVHSVDPPALSVSELQLSVNRAVELGLLAPAVGVNEPLTELSVTADDDGFVTVADTLTAKFESIGHDCTACTT